MYKVVKRQFIGSIILQLLTSSIQSNLQISLSIRKITPVTEETRVRQVEEHNHIQYNSNVTCVILVTDGHRVYRILVFVSASLALFQGPAQPSAACSTEKQ